MSANLKIAITREKPDMLIHLGDIEDIVLEGCTIWGSFGVKEEKE